MISRVTTGVASYQPQKLDEVVRDLRLFAARFSPAQQANGDDHIPDSIGWLAGLIDDGAYLEQVQARMQARFGTKSRDVVFLGLPVVDFPVGDATHSSQDGCRASNLLRMLPPNQVTYAEDQTTGVVLVVRDPRFNQVMIYDGNHRYADACLRGNPTVRARVLVLR